jgi:hypothetical protein
VNLEVRIPHQIAIPGLEFVNEPTCKRGPFRFGDRAGVIRWDEHWILEPSRPPTHHALAKSCGLGRTGARCE